MNEKTFENFKQSEEYNAAMTGLVGVMDIIMNYANETGCSYEEAVEFTKRELKEFVDTMDTKSSVN